MAKVKLNKDFVLACIDGGFHGTKLITINGEYKHIPSMSVQLHKKLHATDIALYMQRGQSENSIMYFIDGEPTCFVLGSDAFNLMKSDTIDDIHFTSRYNTKTYFSSSLYTKELLGQIAYLLYNWEAKKYDKDSYEVILSIGFPAELSIDTDYITRAIQDIKNKTFTLDVVIDKQNDDKNYEKYIKRITISINGIFVSAQPFAALSSLLYNVDGSFKKELNSFTENTIVIDGGYGTLDICQIINRQLVRSSIRTYPSLGMKSVHQQLLQLLKPMNQMLTIQDIRERIDKGIFTIDKETGGTYNFKSDYEEAIQNKKEAFKNLIKDEFYNFANIENIVFAGGVGRIYYNYAKNADEFKNKINNMFLVEVKGLQEQDDIKATLFSIVEGYRNIAIRGLLDTDKTNKYHLEPEDIIIELIE